MEERPPATLGCVPRGYPLADRAPRGGLALAQLGRPDARRRIRGVDLRQRATSASTSAVRQALLQRDALVVETELHAQERVLVRSMSEEQRARSAGGHGVGLRNFRSSSSRSIGVAVG